MEQSILTDLVKTSFGAEAFSKSKMADVSDLNALRLKDVAGVKECNLPSGDDMETIATWMRDYSHKNPSFSKRKVRKDAQAHFNIKVFRAPFKNEKNAV